MTNPETPNPPAGWYPDPEGLQRQRWWDGQRWTADVAPLSAPQPYTGARPQLTAPAGTDWNTPWIWLVLFLPLLPAIPLLFVDWSALTAIDPNTLESDLDRQFAVYTSPAYLASVLGGWLAWGLAVVFAYLDFKTLRDRGVPSPFHWAWAFLSSVVYAIGRGVVTNRRMGKGMVVVWVAVGLIVLGIALGFTIAAMVIGSVFSQLPELSELPTS
ncbi:DUF2510 domain-containing protein [Lysobacter korlensis]|uniref:DUF2510 domain-containing protein n=1 Tax=Lysobacter korlensis TaxID=553636 RepID=A0ABV6RWG7_9GAMM